MDWKHVYAGNVMHDLSHILNISFSLKGCTTVNHEQVYKQLHTLSRGELCHFHFASLVNGNHFLNKGVCKKEQILSFKNRPFFGAFYRPGNGTENHIIFHFVKRHVGG